MIRKNIKNIMLIILVLALVSSWIFFILEDRKPKTSVDLMNIMLTEEYVDRLPFAEEIDENQAKSILYDYLPSNSDTKINQYFTVDISNDEVLLVETTPGLVNGQIYIKNVKEIDENFYENITFD